MLESVETAFSSACGVLNAENEDLDPSGGEKWAKVPDSFDKYWVSSLGRVARGDSGPQEILKCRKSTHGYLAFSACHRGKRKHWSVHRAVLYAFVGPPPPGRPIVRHLNDVGTDNRLENLVWGTYRENSEDWWGKNRRLRLGL